MAEDEEHVQLLHLSKDVSCFGRRARDAASFLYTITYTCSLLPGAEEPQLNVASALYALGGIALCLSDHLTALFSTLCPTYSLHDLKDLEKLMVMCDFIFNQIQTTVQVADRYVHPGSALPFEKGTHRIGAFTREQGLQAQCVLGDCLHAFSRMSMVTRMGVLTQRAELSDEETLESLRLNGALMQKEFQGRMIKLGINQSTMSSQNPRLANTIPLRAFSQPTTCDTSSAALGLTQNQMGNVSSDVPNAVDKVNEPTKGKGRMHETPAPTRESTPEADEPEVARATTPQPEARPKEPKTSTPTTKSDMGLNEQMMSMKLSNNTNINNEQVSSSFTSCDLEAYILRPLVNSSGLFISWYTEIGHLGLDKEAMSAHINNLGPEYSVIDALRWLPADQLRLIQQEAKNRRGNIVSVKRAAPVDMATPMGTFQIRPVIFILALPKNRDQENPTIPSSAIEGKKPAFGSFGTGFGGFGAPAPNINSNLFQTNGPVQEDRFAVPAPLAQTNKPPFKTYQSHRQGQGGVFLVEKSEQGECQYTTITTSDCCGCADNSIEELRLKDYKAGRTGPTIREDKPFGGHYSNPKTGHGSLFGTDPNSSPSNNASLVGFGASNVNNGGLFGRSPTGSGLFGNHVPPSHGQNPFGSPRQTGGLFGTTGQSQQPQPQPQPSTSTFGQPTVCGPQYSCWGAVPRQTGGNSFGMPAATWNTCLFGQKNVVPSFGQPVNSTSTGTFGAEAPPAPIDNSLFGSAPTAPSNGLFGSAPVAPSTGLFGAAPANSSTASASGNTPPHPPRGLFGRPVNSAPEPAPPLSFGQVEPSAVPKPVPTAATTPATGGSFVFAPSASTPAPAPNSAQPTYKHCKKCSTNLNFHTAVECALDLCDACFGIKETKCRLCKHLVQPAESPKNSEDSPPASN